MDRWLNRWLSLDTGRIEDSAASDVGVMVKVKVKVKWGSEGLVGFGVG